MQLSVVLWMNGFIQLLRFKPQSRFMMSVLDWILIASSTPLFQYTSASTTLAPFQSIWWLCVYRCIQQYHSYPLISSLLACALPISSGGLFLFHLYVYTWLQSRHDTSYTTPVFFSCGILFFTFIMYQFYKI